MISFAILFFLYKIYLMINNTEIVFLNHSSFQITKGELNLLIDPWYFLRVFNNTWSLLKEGHEKIKKGITHIFISHEHPDHLHFPTLKYLKENHFLSKSCVLIFPFRKENSVKNAIEKIGISYQEIKDGKKNSLSLGEIECTYYGENEMGDHTMVFNCKDINILNQNDHYTSINVCREILSDFEKIDIMFTQFSIAGYHGNKNDHHIIRNNGTIYHLHKVRDYANIFKPKYLVPFASYVYFCDKYNSYLNNFIVNPNDLKSINLKYSIFQFVTYGDQILLDEELVKKRNMENLKNLNQLFNQKNFEIYQYEKKDIHSIISKIKDHLKNIDFKYWLAFKILKKSIRGKFIDNKEIKLTDKTYFSNIKLYNFFKKIYNIIKLFRLLGINKRFMYIKIEDMENTVIRIDIFSFNKVDIVNDKYWVDFIVPSNQLDFALKFPWGVDTLNVTATGQFYSALPDVFLRLVQKNNLRK
jgi:hypothetical protein